MASYGYLILNDGILPDASVGPGPLSFQVGLGCSQRATSLDGRNAGYVSFSKTINRIAPSKNPLKNAKNKVSEYAGCDEASIVRLRVLALARIKLSVSGEEFRFRLPE